MTVPPFRVATVILVVAAAACSGTTAPTPPPATPTASLVPTQLPSPAGSTLLTIERTDDVAFETSSLNQLGRLDVYAPAERAMRPVVVMLHGNPAAPRVDKNYLSEQAWRVAELGFVVFVPTWGKSGGAAYDALTTKEQLIADGAQAACAVAFAAAHASEYGGDATSLTVFGHSAGGNIGSIVALARPELAAGCIAKTLPQIDVLVAWEGDWLLITEIWDSILVEDPSVREVIAPFDHLPAPADLRFVFLRGEDTEEGREATGVREPNGWFAPRDPTGRFLEALEAAHALDDGWIGPDDTDAILIDRLQAQGSDVASAVMPGSDHASVGSAGWPVFLDVFRAIGASGRAN